MPWLLGGLRLRGGFLGDGPPPQDVSIRDPGVGSLWSLSAALRFRPRPFFHPDEVQRGHCVWLEVAAGGALTGSLVRPSFEVGIGFNFEAGPLDLGPSVRFVHVPHFDDPLDDRSAYLLTVGMEVLFFDARPRPEEAVIPPDAPEPVAEPEHSSDRDGDGILDADDGCPDEPEDHDRWQDADGCPDPDNDADSLLDPDDACPDDSEDFDGFEDDNGCPEPDNDRDGIVDPNDRCPRDPETVNGIDDDDGCPDEGLIALIDDRIVLEETVLFDFNRARVKHSARPVLAAIVALWRLHPEWARVRVEGHADSRGDEEHNQELSELRAARVREALVELGMPAEMIESVGFGHSRPRDLRTTEEAHQANRRVEFVIVARRAIETSVVEGVAEPEPRAGTEGATP